MEQILDTLESFPKNLDRPREISKIKDEGFNSWLTAVSTENADKLSKI